MPPALKQKARFEYARYVFRRDREQGLALLSALRDSQPEEPLAGEVHYWIGEAYRQRGELARALDIFTGIAAARADRTGALAQAGVARVREEQGRREEAAEEYLKVYFLFPELKDLAAGGTVPGGPAVPGAGPAGAGGAAVREAAGGVPGKPRARE